MLVRFIGGVADGQVREVDTPTVLFTKPLPPITDLGYREFDLEIVEYKVHKFVGDKKVFWIACEGSVDEALELLLFKE